MVMCMPHVVQSGACYLINHELCVELLLFVQLTHLHNRMYMYTLLTCTLDCKRGLLKYWMGR